MNGLALGEEIWMLLPLRLFLSVRDLVFYLNSSNIMATSALHISNLFLTLTKSRLRGQHLNRHCVLIINTSCDGCSNVLEVSWNLPGFWTD